MIYDELVRVDELDHQIYQMHQRLTQLQRERLQLLRPNSTTRVRKNAKSLAITSQTPRQLYSQVKIKWQTYEVKIPTFTRLQPQLRAAQTVVRHLQTASPELLGNLVVVVVPPFATLQKTLRTDTNNGPELVFTEAQVQRTMKKSSWDVLVVVTLPQKIADNNIGRFLEQKQYLHLGYDCRAMGVQSLLAFGLQAGMWPARDEWTLLLKDMNNEQVACAVCRDGQLIVDSDSASIAIGQNSFWPAIRVTAKISRKGE